VNAHATVETPLGPVLVTTDGESITGIYLAGQKHSPEAADCGPAWPSNPVLSAAAHQLGEYFSGGRERFDLALDSGGTPFQRRVWEAIGGIPFGDTLTYGELARRIGAPAAVRAVGTAIGRNPISIVVPCHRVIGADGSLTGYAGGLDRKRALLDLERRRVWPCGPGRRLCP
jgi:methylated-DNA-[protein]-cysteine S-methyltransferase